MPTVMENALKEAGIQLPPLKQRVWLWLRDHPDHTAKEVAAALSAPIARVASDLTMLLRRNMLVRKMDRLSRRGSGPATVWRYSVSPSMRGQYEMLPIVLTDRLRVPKGRPCEPVVSVQSAPAAAPSAPAPAADQTTDEQWMEDLVKSLSLTNARKLYDRLKDFFQP